MHIGQRMASAVVILAVLAPAWGQVDTASAQRKVLAKRAADADAYRKLAEAIKGLQITSDTYVKDFVAENDSIRADMDEFIKGVRLGAPKWYADLSCEVPAEVTVARVVQTLQEEHQKYYKGDRITRQDIDTMNNRIDKKIIQVVGMGAPRPDLPPDLPQGVAEQLGGPPIPPEAPIPDLWKQVGPQGRMMAIRAAEVDAKRQLLERIKGLRVNSHTTVRDFVAESDQITAQAMGTIIGATVVRTYLHDDEPIAEVTVEVPVESVITTIKQLHTKCIQGDDVKGSDITSVARQINGKVFGATGMGIPPQKYIQQINVTSPPEQQIPAWAMAPIIAKGNGVAPADKAGTPQGKLLAARAAELDAKRKLAEHIYGLKIASTTSVQDFVAQNDAIRTSVDAVLVGAVVQKTEFEDNGNAALVTVSIPGMSVWEVLLDGIRMGTPAASTTPQDATVPPPPAVAPPPVVAPPPAPAQQ